MVEIAKKKLSKRVILGRKYCIFKMNFKVKIDVIKKKSKAKRLTLGKFT